MAKASVAVDADDRDRGACAKLRRHSCVVGCVRLQARSHGRPSTQSPSADASAHLKALAHRATLAAAKRSPPSCSSEGPFRFRPSAAIGGKGLAGPGAPTPATRVARARARRACDTLSVSGGCANLRVRVTRAHARARAYTRAHVYILCALIPCTNNECKPCGRTFRTMAESNVVSWTASATTRGRAELKRGRQQPSGRPRNREEAHPAARSGASERRRGPGRALPAGAYPAPEKKGFLQPAVDRAHFSGSGPSLEKDRDWSLPCQKVRNQHRPLDPPFSSCYQHTSSELPGVASHRISEFLTLLGKRPLLKEIAATCRYLFVRSAEFELCMKTRDVSNPAREKGKLALSSQQAMRLAHHASHAPPHGRTHAHAS